MDMDTGRESDIDVERNLSVSTSAWNLKECMRKHEEAYEALHTR